MAVISERTKQLVSSERARIKQAMDEIDTEIEHLRSQIEPLMGRKQALRNDLQSLAKDIPEPTPPPEPVL